MNKPGSHDRLFGITEQWSLTDRMFFLQFEAKPARGTLDAKKYAGAFVNCWIVSASQRQAESVAREIISAQGWTVKTTEMVQQVSRQDCDECPESLEFFDQAEIDREVFVYHTWPARRQRKRKTKAANAKKPTTKVSRSHRDG